MRKALCVAVIAGVLGASVIGRADQMKEFTTSCIYGVLAGTLVGAATLAFTSRPGDNLNNVARGASFGLYSGMLLGAYVVYGVRDEGEGPDGEQLPGGDGAPPAPTEEQSNPDEGSLVKPKHHVADLRFFKTVSPILPSAQSPGWGIQASLIEYHF